MNLSKSLLFLFFFISAILHADIIQLENNLFYEKKGENLFFVMEEVDASNVNIWRNYREIQEKTGNDLRYALNFPSRQINQENLASYQKAEDIIRSSSDPIEKFRTCLNFFDKAHVWVAYVLNKEPKERFKLSEIKEVEMAMAVLTHDSAPFQLHMGIARGQVHIKELKPRHGGIAVALHAFAARVAKKIYPKNIYFISTPLPNMRELLAEKLPKHAVAVGSNTEGSLIETLGATPYDDNFEFSLKGRDKKIIFNTKADEAGSKYWWFFSNTQPSEQYPYVVVDLEELAKLNN